MMSQHPRRKLPRGNSKNSNKSEADKPAGPKGAEPAASNGLLAGYLAHEFLTKGTLLGRKIDLESRICGSSSAEAKRSKPNSQAIVSVSGVETKPSAVKEQDSYEEVAKLLKTKGTHIKGIVNPTQLSNWINK
ncbi:hypothetical protein VNO78_20125 [Psophocarpus tetragonolobus]|uniref:Uncharacterized protein n=1 Tax=Psophocarpus tetragonolobus TaxID=3891 RepID=A0AAN9S9C4_PSOTE